MKFIFCHKAVIALFSYALSNYQEPAPGPGIVQGTKKTKSDKWLLWGSQASLKL